MVNRYYPVFDDVEGEVQMEEHPRGDYIESNDYDELIADYDALKVKFDELKGMIEDFNWEAGKIRA